MRRHARVDVLPIVTFNYWFRERDANRQILFIDIHKCSFYNDRTAISMPKSIVSDFNLPESSKRILCLSFYLPSNLVSYLIEGQRREVIVINPDIKLCREEVLKSSSVNPGVRWAGMDVAEQLPHVVMIASFKAQIREVVQVNFLLSDLYAH